MEYVYNLWDICMLWVICTFVVYETDSHIEHCNNMSAESTRVRAYLEAILMDIILILWGRHHIEKKIYDTMNPLLGL